MAAVKRNGHVHLCTSAYGIYTQATAFQGTVTSNYEEMLPHPLFMPGLEALLCATLGPQPSSEGSMSGVLQTRVAGADGGSAG